MEWDCSIAVEVHGSASTVGISVMVMVVVLSKVVAVDGSRGSDGVLEWGSKKWERGRGPVWTCGPSGPPSSCFCPCCVT